MAGGENRVENVPAAGAAEEQELDEFLKKVYLLELEKKLSSEEYKRAKEMTYQEMKRAFPLGGKFENLEEKIVRAREGLNVLREIIVAYIYFGLFFRFRSQTPGKRLLRLTLAHAKWQLKNRPLAARGRAKSEQLFFF